MRLQSVADEDVDASNWDNAAANDVVVCRHEGAIAVDVDVAVDVDDPANGDGFADPAKCSHLERDACRLMPHGGRQLSSYRHCR